MVAPIDQEEDDDPFAVSAKPAPPTTYASSPARAPAPQAYAPRPYPAAPTNGPPGYPADAATPRQPIVLQPQLWTGSTIY
ncbi:MAG TPA: hypothetical protein VFE80_07690 [Beijerinckiaceae bacterium]|nr:hypothetical protein [Beijerinckiaceae bacterium]